MHRHEKLFIGGSWVSPDTDDIFEVISPHTEAPIALVAAAGPADVDAAVTSARTAFDDGPGRVWIPPIASKRCAGSRKSMRRNSPRWPS